MFFQIKISMTSRKLITDIAAIEKNNVKLILIQCFCVSYMIIVIPPLFDVFEAFTIEK